MQCIKMLALAHAHACALSTLRAMVCHLVGLCIVLKAFVPFCPLSGISLVFFLWMFIGI